MNQEGIMKRRMVTAIVLCIIAMIACLVFIGLYIDESNRVQETFRSQYYTSLQHVSDDVTSYLESEGDKDMRYTRLVSDMNTASSYAFLIDNFTDKQIIVNELATCLLKYPEQMTGKLEDVKKAADDMAAGLDKGYDEAKEIVESINKKGN